MIYDKVEIEARSIIGCLKQLDEDMPDDLRVAIKQNLARKIGQGIYDLPEKFSGKVSTKLVDKNGYLKGRRCSEHFYSRQRCGNRIIEAYEQGVLTLEFCIELLDKYRQVHWVTPEENQTLSRIQNSAEHGRKSHVEQYELANVVLVDRPPTAPRWFYQNYVVGGNKYNDITDVAQTFDMSYNEILKRCSSTSKANREWQRIVSRKANT